MIWSRVQAVVVGALLGASTQAQAQPQVALRIAPPAPSPPSPPADQGPAGAPAGGEAPAVASDERYQRPRGGCGTPGGTRLRPGFKLTLNRVFTQKIADGYGGRLEFDIPVMPLWEASPIFGFTPLGIEAWGSKQGGGGGLPFAFYAGFGSPNLFATVGAGWEWLAIDRIQGRTGVSFFAPLANAAVGVWIKRFRLAADGRAIYRWHIGDVDRRQYTAGLSLLYMP